MAKYKHDTVMDQLYAYAKHWGMAPLQWLISQRFYDAWAMEMSPFLFENPNPPPKEEPLMWGGIPLSITEHPEFEVVLLTDGYHLTVRDGHLHRFQYSDDVRFEVEG